MDTEALNALLIALLQKQVAEPAKPEKKQRKKKLYGKHYLRTKCRKAIKYNDSRGTDCHLRYGRQIEITDDDRNEAFIGTIQNYVYNKVKRLLYSMKQGMFPFRCVDEKRIRFYYNHHISGWVEDNRNDMMIQFIRDILHMTWGSSMDGEWAKKNKLINTNDGGLSNEIVLGMKCMNFGCEIESKDSNIYKSKKTADSEMNTLLSDLASLLKIDEDDVSSEEDTDTASSGNE